MTAANLPALLQRFFTDRLRAQLGASPHTVASYRDTFRLLLVFVSERLACAPSKMRVEDLDTAVLTAFLEHLERGRSNAPTTSVVVDAFDVRRPLVLPVSPGARRVATSSYLRSGLPCTRNRVHYLHG